MEPWQFFRGAGSFRSRTAQRGGLDLGAENQTSWGDARLAHLADKLKLVDGTLLPALPRMHWALWLSDQNRAAKLHLKFSMLRQGACDAPITAGNSCERKALRQFVKKGEIIVADRYYALEYGFFGELKKIGTSHVIRIRNKPRMEVVEELDLTEATARWALPGRVKSNSATNGRASRSEWFAWKWTARTSCSPPIWKSRRNSSL